MESVDIELVDIETTVAADANSDGFSARAANDTMRIIASAAACLAFGAAQSDSKCGNATTALVPGRPNVLLVGDSISMVPPYTPGGYGAALQTLLEAQGIAVQHAGGWYAGGQCSNTVKGLLCTNVSTPNSYVVIPGGGEFDLVHYNYGLHDLVAACVPPATGECEEHVNLGGPYGANVVELYRRFRAVSKLVMWVSTTPVPNVTTSMGRTYELAVAYNAEARTALAQHLAPLPPLVNDLWSAFIGVCGPGYHNCTLQLPKNVHLTPAGIAFAANVSATAIVAALATLPVRAA